MIKEIIFFDTETNGFKGSSVLSISAIKVGFDTMTKKFIKLDEYDRFYFRNPGEMLNQGAIDVNGLTDEEITKRRGQNSYEKYYLDDVDSFKEFCKNAKHYVAHNISFDRSFIPFKLKNELCTMKTNTEIVKKGWDPIKQKYKWPKLIETAKFYNVKLDPNELHNSLYDVLITFRIFFRMYNYEQGKPIIEEFISKK